jgi:hypothetical protein
MATTLTRVRDLIDPTGRVVSAIYRCHRRGVRAHYLVWRDSLGCFETGRSATIADAMGIAQSIFAHTTLTARRPTHDPLD